MACAKVRQRVTHKYTMLAAESAQNDLFTTATVDHQVTLIEMSATAHSRAQHNQMSWIRGITRTTERPTDVADVRQISGPERSRRWFFFM